MANKKKSKNQSKAKKQTKTKKPMPNKSVNETKAAPAKAGKEDGIILLIRAICGLLALFLLFCYIWPDASGTFGRAIRTGLFGAFGVSSVLLPTFLLLLAVFLKRLWQNGSLFFRMAWAVLAQVCIATFCGVFTLESPAILSAGDFYEKCSGFRGGGVVGGMIAQWMHAGVGSVFTAIIMMLLFIVFGALTVGITPVVIADYIGGKVSKGAKTQKEKLEERRRLSAEKKAESQRQQELQIQNGPAAVVTDKPRKNKKAYDYENEEPDIIPHKKDALDELLDSDDEGVNQFVRSPAEIFFEDGILVDKPVKVAPEPVKDTLPEEKTINDKPETIETVKEPVGVKISDLPEPKKPAPVKDPPPYKFPPLKLLSLPDGKGSGISAEEAKSNARKIVETLSNFGISVSVENISCGPTITRYELRPAPGVRISRIGNLIDDLARVLASGGVRFESSIEGKDTVGIEVPNKAPFTVNIRTLLDTDTFRNAKSKVFCALGVDISNEPTFLDIQKMPHMIIAGATGMGKSVCINSLIVSILYRAKPDEVKLIMIDPKKVEFAPYVGIPHLLVPVITDMKKAAGALNWLVQEMERRYDLIEATGCRNIYGYNETAKNNPDLEKLPIMVIIIDELADLMATSKDNVESSIARIAAKARAAGMHLIIGTQRPDVSVISGTIKNNIPSRIACRVGSQIDSRTILDEGGAERLIGRGDMLYKPVGALKLTRLQGSFVSDDEVEAVVNFIKNQGLEANYSDEAIRNIDKEAENISDGKKKLTIGGGESGDDELLLSAIEISFDAGKVATSLLNRKLSIGYGRAAKIIDRMEEMGICSGANGSKPRELIMSREQFMAKYGSDE
ncbi:MAG: DNA translocase FtsK [Clostridia bacterium]|nr:DNA translocase FtsK [Clostridia bacterium]